MQDLLKKAGTTVDPELRRQAYSEAIRLATERVDFVPLFSAVRYVAFSKRVEFPGLSGRSAALLPLELEVGIRPSVGKKRDHDRHRMDLS